MSAGELPLVVVGSGGRLGRALFHHAREGRPTVGFDRTSLDLADPASITAALEPLEFGCLVNCAALTNVDLCETDPTSAFGVNATAVGEIGRICQRKRARMINIGTDYVFDGENPLPYTEEDSPNPVSHYGRSKWEGEQEMLAASSEFLNIRVSWVFGPERPSFIDWIYDQAREKPHVEAIGDKTSSPSYTDDLVPWILTMADRSEGGFLHLCNAGRCSWQEYGQFAIDTAREAGVSFTAPQVGFVPLASMTKFVARRPLHTAMSTAKFATLTGLQVPDWKDAVRRFVLAHKVSS